MAVKNTAQVVIGGKIITLGGYESEEYFQKVASYINNKMSELSEMPGYSRQPMETKHTLLSLNVTDDYFKAKKQAEILEAEGEQEYMKILAQAYGEEERSEFYSFVRSLDALKASMKGGNKTIILSSDSPIAQIFEGK